METGSRAVVVEVAPVVHGLLQTVALPSEDVITVCCGTAGKGEKGKVSKSENHNSGFLHLPKVHAVDEGLGAVGGPHGLVGVDGDVPHELVHDLGELDGVGRGARAATVGTVTLAVGDVGLVVRRVKVLAIPASAVFWVRILARKTEKKRTVGKRNTYVGKMMVWRIILHEGSAGMSTVSLPVQGAPPTNWLWFVEVQQRLQMLALVTLLTSVLAASPAIIRKP